MQYIQMAVFDMAGTTIDEDNVVYKTVQKAINNAGIDVSLEEVLEIGAGQEKREAIKNVLALKNINNEEQVDDIFTHFKVMLDEAYHTHPVSAQKNASALFTELKKRNIIVVLNTGYTRPVAQYLIDKLGWVEGDHFDLLVTASDVEKSRPFPDMIWHAMKAFHITDARSVLKVGDSAIDIEEGKNAGCGITIGVLTGAQTRQQLEKAHPDFILNDLSELLPVVDDWSRE